MTAQFKHHGFYKEGEYRLVLRHCQAGDRARVLNPKRRGATIRGVPSAGVAAVECRWAGVALALGGSSPWARATGNLITRDGPESSGSAEAVEVPASDSAHGVRDPFQVCRATVSSATMVGGE